MGKRRPAKKPRWQKEIAKERIEILLAEAEKAVKEGKVNFANRYARLAKLIGMRYNVRLTKEQKRRICKYCDAFLYPGITCRVKFDPKSKRVKIRCSICGKLMSIPYKLKK